jgi:hypothetical protein
MNLFRQTDTGAFQAAPREAAMGTGIFSMHYASAISLTQRSGETGHRHTRVQSLGVGHAAPTEFLPDFPQRLFSNL